MTLYETLAPVYDLLFPVDAKAPAFLDSLARGEAAARGSIRRSPRVLDAGCATGGHALALAALGWSAVGIDSEAAMIGAAKERALRELVPAGGYRPGRASFLEADLLDIGNRFRGEGFDLILCLGNTLPHLADAGGGTAGAASFLSQARALLEGGGSLVLQTLNFSLPGIGPGYAFPPIVGGGATMLRSYSDPPRENPGALRFVVELRGDGGSQVGETLLLPLGPERIAALLREAGFGALARYSGWDGRPFDEGRDPYCIAVARA
jgi:glycine/sarcosine N-methyltransferase